MNRKDTRALRLYVLAGLLTLVLLMFAGVLYNTQIVNHDYYVAQSIRTIAREEKVEASRGVITDRNGQVMVSSRSTYSLTFDSSLLKDGEDPNEAILRLVQLCQANGVSWIDNLPISRQSPYTYTLDSMTDTLNSRFLKYVISLKPASEALGNYLLEHPETVGESTDSIPTLPSEVDQNDTDAVDAAKKAAKERADELLELLTKQRLSAQLLTDAGISPETLMGWMREDLEVPESFSQAEARLVLGIQYELSVRKVVNTTAYVMADDISTGFISLLADGKYSGAKVTASSVREYSTTYAAQILGQVTPIYATDPEYQDGTLREKGYAPDDKIGRSGVEKAFEEYLRGTDGTRVVSTNSDGKVTGEFYSEQPQPGSTVELTIDLDLQQAVEENLAATVAKMNAEDGDSTRGAGCAIVQVGTGEILALASYPTFDPSTYSTNYAAISSNLARPEYNRATQGTYAPGSTLKPLTAVAALETGNVTLTEKINDTGKWTYPGSPQSYTYCWDHSGHGLLNVTQAITNSCNYFFAEMGYRMGMNTLVEYLKSFGLGSHTGVEVGDSTGTLPENPPGEDQAPWAAFGQSSQAYTPLQLANYIATLVSGGQHCEAHLLKAAKSYDNSEVLAVGDSSAKNVVSIKDSTLEAVKKGMLGYTQPGGQLYSYFRSCVVEAGAKTGTAQLGGGQTNNGVFVCFAPYDDPQIALAMVIEHGNAGAALASTAVNILNAYFSADEIGTAVIGENQLLQ